MRDKDSKLIFIGGIHGVGKSTLCEALGGIQHIPASTLIRNYKKIIEIEDRDSEKRVENISKNQDILISALNNFEIDDPYYILDGHYTLFDSKGCIQPIPVETFKNMQPIALIMIFDEPTSIKEKLRLRDCKDYSIEVLEEMQNTELQHARTVANNLGVELQCIHVNSLGVLKEYIYRILKTEK